MSCGSFRDTVPCHISSASLDLKLRIMNDYNAYRYITSSVIFLFLIGKQGKIRVGNRTFKVGSTFNVEGKGRFNV